MERQLRDPGRGREAADVVGSALDLALDEHMQRALDRDDLAGVPLRQRRAACHDAAAHFVGGVRPTQAIARMTCVAGSPCVVFGRGARNYGIPGCERLPVAATMAT
jgi:hypothetical protein